jgi:hypothetical protein
MLVAELPAATLDGDTVGLALARQLAVADRFHAETEEWLKAGGWPTEAPAPGRRPEDQAGLRLLERFAADVAEFAGNPEARPK